MKDKFKRVHMKVAQAYAGLSYAQRRQVGCVIVIDDIVVPGYNGTPSGWDNCCEVPDGSATLPEVIHAEQNALLQCRNVQEIAVAYVTTQPCMTCTKLLLNTSCHTIIYNEPYVHQQAAELWIKNGRTIIQAADAISRSFEGEKDSGRL